VFTILEDNLSVSFLLAMAPPPDSGGGGSGLMSTLIMFALIIGIFYFLILRPQQKRQKEREKLLSSVKKGDKIITAGGLHGTIAGIDDKTLLIQVADNVKMKFERSAVGTIVKESDPSAKNS
jgi:preprotein translocase subunit YajC